MDNEITLSDIIEVAARSMDPAPMVIRGTPQSLNMDLDDFKGEFVVCILPNTESAERSKQANKFSEFHLSKFYVLTRSDVATAMPDRMDNTDACFIVAKEIYARAIAYCGWTSLPLES